VIGGPRPVHRPVRAALVLAFAGAASPALADPASPDPPDGGAAIVSAPPVARKRPLAVKAEPPAETRPAPSVTLTLDVPTTRGPWTMRVTNRGAVPVRIAADARLLSLEVTPRGARAPVHCELPDDMRPADDLEVALTLAPGRSYAESFEPRMYCFEGKLDALTAGAVVGAHLGWVGARKLEAPFAVSPIDGAEPAVAPLKALEGSPVALPDEPSSWPGRATMTAVDDDSPRAPLSLQGPRAVDADWPNDIRIPLTLRNDGIRPVVVRFRPATVRFEIVGPAGVETCVWPLMPAAAMRELFATLPPKGSETLDLMLSSYCTEHGLDRGGLIVVRPVLDTRNASGLAVGLSTFDGEVTAAAPTLLRLHRGATPQPTRRPRPEP
jgi:hypothetical protein